MATRKRPLVLRYGSAVVIIALATWIRLLLDPFLEDKFAFITYFVAVVLVAWYGGFGPSLAALVLSWPAVAYFVLAPRGSLAIHGMENQVGFGVFVFVGLAIALLSGSMHAAKSRAERAGEVERAQREQLHVTLKSIGDAVIAADKEGRVTFLNPTAQSLTGWTQQEAAAEPLESVFKIINEQTRGPAENPVAKVLREGAVVGLANHTVLIARNGTERPVDDSAAPIRDEQGNVSGVVLVFRDVTERRRAEQTRSLLAAIVESSEDAIIGKTLDGIVTSWNKGAERLYGYRAAEVVGKPVSVLIPPGHADELPRILEQLKRGERIDHWETVRQRKDGQMVDVSLSMSPIRNSAGQIVGASAIARDITASKRAAEALRESEALKRAVVETALDAIVIMDHEGRVVEFNPAAESLFGYRRADVLGQNMGDLIIPPALRENHRRGLAHYLATGEGPVLNRRIEMPALRADGTEFPVELAIVRIPTDGPAIFTGYLRDLTERKRAERRRSARLAVTEILAQAATVDEAAPRLLQAVCDSLGWDAGGLWLVDPKAQVLRCLEVWHTPSLQVAGFEAASRQGSFAPGVGLPGRVWASGKPAWIPDVTQDANFPRAAIASREGLHGAFGFPILLGTEVRGIFEFFSRAIQEPDPDTLEMMATIGGQIGQFLERKAAERALRESEKELKQTDRLKDEFLAMLAHELRNPLAPIRNSLHIIKQPQATGALKEQVRDMAERQVQHMARLLDDLLDVSRISRGRIELRKEIMDLVSIIHHSVQAVRPLIEERCHELTVSVPPEALWMEADPHRLEQVLTNLLNNAAKYTDPGGHIWLSAARAGTEVVVRVRDTGIGIARDMLPRVFDVFVQAERRLDRSQGGVGIGLTLVKKLAELHGGTVDVFSAGLGQGSEFIMHLPALRYRETGPEEEPAALPSSASKLPSRRVLVVDDNQDAAESLATLLRLAAQDVRVAHDGPAALEAAQDFQPDMVFLDIGMPGMDGYEVARRLRQQPGLNEPVLVALTGWGQEEDQVRSQAAGFDHHLVKPAELNILHTLLAHPRPTAQLGIRD